MESIKKSYHPLTKALVRDNLTRLCNAQRLVTVKSAYDVDIVWFLAEHCSRIEFAGASGLSDSIINRAKALLVEGRASEAEQICCRALSNNPNDLEINIFLGSLYMDSGRSADAE